MGERFETQADRLDFQRMLIRRNSTAAVEDATHSRLEIEEFKRRMAATRNGDTGDITRGK